MFEFGRDDDPAVRIAFIQCDVLFLKQIETRGGQGAQKILLLRFRPGGAFHQNENAVDVQKRRDILQQLDAFANGTRRHKLAALKEFRSLRGRFATAERIAVRVLRGGCQLQCLVEKFDLVRAAVHQRPAAVRQPCHERQARIAAARTEIDDDVVWFRIGGNEILNRQRIKDMELQIVQRRDDSRQIEGFVDEQQMAVEGFQNRAFRVVQGQFDVAAGVCKPFPCVVRKG